MRLDSTAMGPRLRKPFGVWSPLSLPCWCAQSCHIGRVSFRFQMCEFRATQRGESGFDKLGAESEDGSGSWGFRAHFHAQNDTDRANAAHFCEPKRSVATERSRPIGQPLAAHR
jgi:hypothetical protein